MHEVSLSSREKGTKSYIVTTMYIANSSRAFVIQDENLTQCDMTSLSKNKRLLLDEIVSTIHKVFFFFGIRKHKNTYTRESTVTNLKLLEINKTENYLGSKKYDQCHPA